MSNICETTIAFFATTEKYTDKLVDFYNKLTDLKKSKERFPIYYNSIYIAEQFGIDAKHIEWSCIQDISDIEAHGTYRGFKVYQDDKWTPNLRFWDLIIEREYTTDDGERMIDYVYEAEEPGCEIYINTDVDGEFFCDLYKVDAHLPKDLFCGEIMTEYFSSTEDLFDALKTLVGKIFNFDESNDVNLKIFINDYLKKRYPNSDYYLSIHEFKEEKL